MCVCWTRKFAECFHSRFCYILPYSNRSITFSRISFFSDLFVSGHSIGWGHLNPKNLADLRNHTLQQKSFISVYQWTIYEVFHLINFFADGSSSQYHRTCQGVLDTPIYILIFTGFLYQILLTNYFYHYSQPLECKMNGRTENLKYSSQCFQSFYILQIAFKCQIQWFHWNIEFMSSWKLFS